MSELKSICGDAGFLNVQTYIASGNVVFESKASESKVKSELEARLRDYLGKPAGVIIRTAAEMQTVLKANPFKEEEPKYTLVIFLDEQPPRDALNHATGIADEQMRLGGREIFVHYGSGMGRSKLKIPAAKLGTARNMNTVAKLIEMALRP
jgi:uncharacterized protein (DUF1697 family)